MKSRSSRIVTWSQLRTMSGPFEVKCTSVQRNKARVRARFFYGGFCCVLGPPGLELLTSDGEVLDAATICEAWPEYGYQHFPGVVIDCSWQGLEDAKSERNDFLACVDLEQTIARHFKGLWLSLLQVLVTTLLWLFNKSGISCVCWHSIFLKSTGLPISWTFHTSGTSSFLRTS